MRGGTEGDAAEDQVCEMRVFGVFGLACKGLGLRVRMGRVSGGDAAGEGQVFTDHGLMIGFCEGCNNSRAVGGWVGVAANDEAQDKTQQD